jgi:hypothetical protein
VKKSLMDGALVHTVPESETGDESLALWKHGLCRVARFDGGLYSLVSLPRLALVEELTIIEHSLI